MNEQTFSPGRPARPCSPTSPCRQNDRRPVTDHSRLQRWLSSPGDPTDSGHLAPTPSTLTQAAQVPQPRALSVSGERLPPTVWSLHARSVVSDSVTPWTVACQAPLSMCSPGKNTGVGCHSLLQGIFQNQGWNPSPASPAPVSIFFTTSDTREAPHWLDLPSKETVSGAALMGVYTGWIQ